MYQLVLVVLAVNLGSGGVHSSTTTLSQVYAKKDDCMAALGAGSVDGRIAEKIMPRSNAYFDIEPICVQVPASH
jgi:hypothetical protein